MPCFHPWEPGPAMGLGPLVKQLPCGQCAGCRLERSRQQAARCIHESKSHKYNTWATLTYDYDHLPQRYNTGLIHPKTRQPIYSGSLHPLHVPKFIRTTRKALVRGQYATEIACDQIMTVHSRYGGAAPIPRIKADLRYYYAGEYGELYARPHYHICLFGLEFTDKRLIQVTDAGYKLYESKTLDILWPHGQHMIGDLTFETAAYTARYIMKKINGQKADEHYTKIDHDTGEIFKIKPEFNESSRRPGLGREHYEKHKKDYYKKEKSQINIRGNHSKPPRYYDKQYEKTNPEHYKILKFNRQMEAIKNKFNTSPARLKAEEIITQSKIKSLKGTL